MRPVDHVVDCATGETREVEVSDRELALRAKHARQHEDRQAEEETARASLLVAAAALEAGTIDDSTRDRLLLFLLSRAGIVPEARRTAG